MEGIVREHNSFIVSCNGVNGGGQYGGKFEGFDIPYELQRTLKRLINNRNDLEEQNAKQLRNIYQLVIRIELLDACSDIEEFVEYVNINFKNLGLFAKNTIISIRYEFNDEEGLLKWKLEKTHPSFYRLGPIPQFDPFFEDEEISIANSIYAPKTFIPEEDSEEEH